MKVMVLDVGGTHVKILVSGKRRHLQFDSGPRMTARIMAVAARKLVSEAGWTYDVVRMINDAAMQALGSYRGGRMLFLGLGTGLGSALIVDSALEPMELAHLPFKKGKTYEDYVGDKGLKRYGKKKWRKFVLEVVEQLRAATQAQYVILGGGNARLIKKLPSYVCLGDNANAFRGGFRLWDAKKVVRF